MINQLSCVYSSSNKKINKIIVNVGNYFGGQNNDDNEKIEDENLILDDAFIILSILKNNIKYFLCLNSNQDSFKIYANKNFGYNLGRRRLDISHL